MAITTYGQEAFAHYHVLQTESIRDMPTVDMGYYRLGDARRYVDDMLKRILHRAKTVSPTQSYICVEQVIGDIRKDWRVQVLGVSAWRDLLKGHIIPCEAKYGPVNLDNTYYEIKRCRDINCKPELQGEMTKNQAKYIQWYDHAMGYDLPIEYIEVDNDDSDGDDIEQALTEIDFGLDDTVVMNGNEVILGHQYY